MFFSTGARKHDADVFYLLKMKDHALPDEIITSANAIKRYPELVIEFLEHRMVWFKQVQFALNTDAILESDAPDVDPIKITCKIIIIHIKYNVYRRIFQH